MFAEKCSIIQHMSGAQKIPYYVRYRRSAMLTFSGHKEVLYVLSGQGVQAATRGLTIPSPRLHPVFNKGCITVIVRSCGSMVYRLGRSFAR